MRAAFLLITFSSLSWADPLPIEARIARLIEQLGSPQYRQRESAGRELLALGIKALPAVEKGQSSTDPEIASRCSMLIPQLIRSDLEIRLKTLIDQPKARPPEGLPMIDRWLELVGDSLETRQMYRSMADMHLERLITTKRKPDQELTNYQAFTREVGSQMLPSSVSSSASGRQTATEGDLLTFLFLGALAPERKGISPGISITHFYSFLNSSILTEKLREEKMGQHYRRLFVAWLKKEKWSTLVRRGLDIATQAEMKEVMPMALELAQDKTGTIFNRAYGIIYFSRIATPQDMDKIAPLLREDTQVSAGLMVNGERWSVQIRDVALGSTILAYKQSPRDFGFERMTSDAMRTTYSYYGLPSDLKRIEALTQWENWRKANPAPPAKRD